MQTPTTTPSGFALFLPLIIIALTLLVPIARILRRTGHSRWCCVLGMIPLANMIGLWVLAYIPWPGCGQNVKLTQLQRGSLISRGLVSGYFSSTYPPSPLLEPNLVYFVTTGCPHFSRQ